MAPFSTNDNSMMWQETNMFVIIGSEISYITLLQHPLILHCRLCEGGLHRHSVGAINNFFSSSDASSFDSHLIAFFERFQCSVYMYACSKQMKMMVVKRTMMAEVKG